MPEAFAFRIFWVYNKVCGMLQGERDVHQIRAYVDTSVFGGIEDEEFSGASKRFFDHVRKGEFALLVSEETIRELAEAPESVRAFWESLPKDALEQVFISEDVKELAEAYIQAGILGRAATSDALHVAAASVASADLILSWNFKHIVNFSRIKGFNGVNVMNGYPLITILCPLEVGNDD